MTRVMSFDIFDTVLTRLVGAPDRVHHLTGQHLCAAGVITVSPAAYAAARQHADHDLGARWGHPAPLAIVAAEVVVRLGLVPVAAKALVDAELGVEREVCRPVPGAVERLATARRRTGRGVVFVSDTPLPEAFLRELLAHHHLLEPGDQLFGSADRGADKHGGGLFDVVAAELGERPEDIEHVGDNRHSDVVQARRHGWRAHHDARGSLNVHEELLERSASDTDGVSSRLAGASRLARLDAVHRGADPALAALAAGVGLPLLVGFGAWVVRQARLLELDRLYFLSRDGEVLLDVAAPLAASARAVTSCHYLRGSRLAWNLPSTAAPLGRNRDEWLHDDRDQRVVSARLKLARLGLTPEAAYRCCGSPLLAPWQADRHLSADEQRELYELLAVGPLADQLTRTANEQHALMLRYLDQEGVTAPGRVGIVDVGWRGRINRSLEEVLRSADRPLPAAHLFVALLEDARSLMGPDLHDRSRAWLFDESRHRGVQRVRNSDIVMIESFTKSSQPYTRGYEVVGGRVEAQLVEAVDAAAVQAVLADYRDTVSMGIVALLEGGPVEDGLDLASVVWRQLLAFWRRPGVTEALAWGQLPWSEHYDGHDHVPLAPPLRLRAIAAGLRAEGVAWRPRSLWRAGTAAASSPPLRAAQRGFAVAQIQARRVPKIAARLRSEVALRRGP